MQTERQQILVTGATGRIGRVVVRHLLDAGFDVRATTSKPVDPHGPVQAGLSWITADLSGDGDFATLVDGCVGVVHLAAEIGRMELMDCVNWHATRKLAAVAEAAGVRSFVYTSTVSVYGSGPRRSCDESSPVLTADQDVKTEYWALPYVRAYGRTKLLGEHQIRRAAQRTAYLIFRPTVVVDATQILEIGRWSLAKRSLAAHRHSHHVNVADVADAMVWGLREGLEGRVPPGAVETYNLCEDEQADPTHADFLRKAHRLTGDRRFAFIRVPATFDWLQDFLKVGGLPLRYRLWAMRFSGARLNRAGFHLKHGMAAAYAEALARLRDGAT
jgi:nucleoside-diphosphate-sugar epimerase